MPTGPRPIGQFCWINVLSPKPEVERTFFAQLFGWEYAEIPGMGHRILVGGKNIGGLFPNTGPDGAVMGPPGIGVMVRVESADATAEKAKALGGSAKPAFDIGPQGRMAELVDPAGAMIDIWQPYTPGVLDADSSHHGVPSWFETITTDVARARSFYCDLFGWSAQEMPMGDFAYTVFSQGEEMVAGMMPRLPHMGDFPSHWGVYFTVTDVDATARQVPALGGSVMVEPTDIPGTGRFCGITSPSGVMCYAITYPLQS
jgi:uncharacterized protein